MNTQDIDTNNAPRTAISEQTRKALSPAYYEVEHSLCRRREYAGDIEQWDNGEWRSHPDQGIWIFKGCRLTYQQAQQLALEVGCTESLPSLED